MGRRKKETKKKAVPEFISRRNKRMKMLVTSCIKDVDSIEMSNKSKSGEMGPWEGSGGGRHAVIKFTRAVSMAAESKKTVRKRRRLVRYKDRLIDKRDRQKDRGVQMLN